MKKIYLGWYDVWKYAECDYDGLIEEPYVIAENVETGLELVLSAEKVGGIRPIVSVVLNGKAIKDYHFRSEEECDTVLEELYEDLLTKDCHIDSSAEIIIPFYGIWDFHANLENHDFYHTVAVNRATGITIVVTSGSECDVVLETFVFLGNEEVERMPIHDALECFEVMAEIYNEYLSDDIPGITDTDDVHEQEISDNEETLDEAFDDLLSVLLWNTHISREKGQKKATLVTISEDIKDKVCEYLYTSYGISVYRPMYLEGENGKDTYCEFPYEEMELESADGIWKSA